jgi:hypothetical protein
VVIAVKMVDADLNWATMVLGLSAWTVDDDALGHLGGVDAALDRLRQALLEQHLSVGSGDPGHLVGQRLGLAQQADDGEGVIDEVGLGVGRPHRQVDGVTDALAELGGDVAAQRHLACGSGRATLAEVQGHRAVVRCPVEDHIARPE